jgi:hypothetical protein
MFYTTLSMSAPLKNHFLLSNSIKDNNLIFKVEQKRSMNLNITQNFYENTAFS